MNAADMQCRLGLHLSPDHSTCNQEVHEYTFKNNSVPQPCFVAIANPASVLQNACGKANKACLQPRVLLHTADENCRTHNQQPQICLMAVWTPTAIWQYVHQQPLGSMCTNSHKHANMARCQTQPRSLVIKRSPIPTSYHYN